MTHTQVYMLSRLTVSRDHTRKQIYPNKNSPHPPPQDINISATWLLHQRSLISNRPHRPPPPPSPSPGNFPLMTTALKDLTLKAARHWVVNLILRIVSYTSTQCGVHFDIVCSPHVVFLSEGRRKMLEKYSKRLPRLSSLCMYTSFQIQSNAQFETCVILFEMLLSLLLFFKLPWAGSYFSRHKVLDNALSL